MSNQRRRLRTGAVAVATAVSAALMLSACTGTPSEPNTTSDPDAPIVVWTDETRKPYFEAYQEAHPDVELEITVADLGQLLTKIQLFNRAGKGWPDVVFTGDPNQIAALASPLYDEFPAVLDDLVPEDVQEGFGTGNDRCVIDGKLVCLTNDLAPTVLFVNQPLLDEFGYTVPTTWDEYQELGADLAANHPGYSMGAMGDALLYYSLFWSSGCPTQDPVDSVEVVINTADQTCTRVADLVDPMLENGSLSSTSPFDESFIKLAQEGKLLMTPGPVWYGDLFKAESLWNAPAGTLSVAPLPTWEGEGPLAGNFGGGIYIVSRHAANLEGAADVATWVSTNLDVQSTAITYPAYEPAAEAWAANQGDYFVNDDAAAIFAAAVPTINPAYQPVRYNAPAAFGDTVTKSVLAGGTVAEALEAFGVQLTQLAQQAGYAVSDK